MNATPAGPHGPNKSANRRSHREEAGFDLIPWSTPHCGTAVALAVVAALVGSSAAGLDLVRDGKPVAFILVPAQPLPVESCAAKELQYHIESATGDYSTDEQSSRIRAKRKYGAGTYGPFYILAGEIYMPAS